MRRKNTGKAAVSASRNGKIRPRAKASLAQKASTAEVAAAMGVKPRLVQAWARRGCPHRRERRPQGAVLRFDLDAVRAWRQEHAPPRPPSPPRRRRRRHQQPTVKEQVRLLRGEIGELRAEVGRLAGLIDSTMSRGGGA